MVGEASQAGSILTKELGLLEMPYSTSQIPLIGFFCWRHLYKHKFMDCPVF